MAARRPSPAAMAACRYRPFFTSPTKYNTFNILIDEFIRQKFRLRDSANREEQIIRFERLARFQLDLEPASISSKRHFADRCFRAILDGWFGHGAIP